VENQPYVPEAERFDIDQLVHTADGIVHIGLRFGFQDEQDIPAALRLARGSSDTELNFDAENATYFVSRLTLTRGDAPGMATWRKRVFVGLAHNAASPADNFCIPIDRVVVMGAHLDV
jgi:KUP system potassium uptake protein